MPWPTKRRVLSVIHGPVFGGAHNQLVKLDPALREHGFETIAAVPPEAEGAARRIEAAGIEVIRVPLGSFRLSRDPRDSLAAASDGRTNIRALRGLIRSQRIDLVQVHGVVNIHAGVAAYLEDAAIVWQLLDSRAPMALRRAVMPLVVRVADTMTSWGRGLAAAHPGALSLGDRLTFVYPPVDPGLRPDLEQAASARARLRVPAGAMVVGSVGVRNATKGHEYLVRAAAEIRSHRDDVVFRVLGAPSPSHASLMDSIEEEARRLGLLGSDGIEFVDPGTEATALLQAFDLFAMTSLPRSEGMPTAILEAMACAKAVVATDVGSVRELVADDETGAVVPARDPETVAAALIDRLEDADRREREGAAGLERARTEFRLDRLGELHATAYRQAAARRPAAR